MPNSWSNSSGSSRVLYEMWKYPLNMERKILNFQDTINKDHSMFYFILFYYMMLPNLNEILGVCWIESNIMIPSYFIPSFHPFRARKGIQYLPTTIYKIHILFVWFTVSNVRKICNFSLTLLTPNGWQNMFISFFLAHCMFFHSPWHLHNLINESCKSIHSSNRELELIQHKRKAFKII